MDFFRELLCLLAPSSSSSSLSTSFKSLSHIERVPSQILLSLDLNMYDFFQLAYCSRRLRALVVQQEAFWHRFCVDEWGFFSNRAPLRPMLGYQLKWRERYYFFHQVLPDLPILIRHAWHLGKFWWRVDLTHFKGQNSAHSDKKKILAAMNEYFPGHNSLMKMLGNCLKECRNEPEILSLTFSDVQEVREKRENELQVATASQLQQPSIGLISELIDGLADNSTVNSVNFHGFRSSYSATLVLKVLQSSILSSLSLCESEIAPNAQEIEQYSPLLDKFSVSDLDRIVDAILERGKMEELELKVRLDDACAWPLGRLIRESTSLLNLKIPGQVIHDHGFNALALALSQNKTKLSFLSLRHSKNFSSRDDVLLSLHTQTNLCRALRDNQALRTLNLDGFQFSNEGMELLVEAICTSNIVNLSLITNSTITWDLFVIEPLIYDSKVEELSVNDEHEWEPADERVMYDGLLARSGSKPFSLIVRDIDFIDYYRDVHGDPYAFFFGGGMFFDEEESEGDGFCHACGTYHYL